MGSETERSQEQEPQLSYSAARFSLQEQDTAIQVYTALQEIIRTTSAELSAYRFMIPSEQPNTKPWIVAILGEIPSSGDLYEQIRSMLTLGEVTTLPDHVVQELVARRVVETEQRTYTEKHYTFKAKKKEKPKQKRDPRHRGRKR